MPFAGYCREGCNENNNEPAVPQESEVTLFDKNVMPAAYINYAHNDTAIYIWDGTAVAYVENEKKIYTSTAVSWDGIRMAYCMVKTATRLRPKMEL